MQTVSQVEDSNGRTRRLANGSTVIVQSINERGELVLGDGATLGTRQVVHGYAMTAHAAQGLTADKGFIAGAISREGLYVSATHGREAIRVFVPDRETFLAAAELRSEAGLSAMEFVRQHARGTDLRSVLAVGGVSSSTCARTSRQASHRKKSCDKNPRRQSCPRSSRHPNSPLRGGRPTSMMTPDHAPVRRGSPHRECG